ncbi:CRISPR-associated helicase Cas3' [Methanobacterium sp. 42_16]|uniref:CRISPR-associated helicase Cas3' n=1 Tax=Methanobacterium sp. 42_16 TaxID=1641383 RepID=UPI00074601D1|nr:CRISPR-associated helicase Cas3' [Methanobacterium sp. 42_16]KUK73062.1 MAG: CRISPR-associated helicase Cas3 [Methanobacterium sp. 42_16]KUL02611.1 MAG: CRISPR-associated helicase Cas3 [Methanomicrobiales archaeon 53_19]
MISGIKAKTSGETLEEHTLACLSVFSSLRECYPDIGEKIGYPNFHKTIFNALFFHDFGKAATGFQEQLNGGKKWHYRHEILSVPFVDALPGGDTDLVKLFVLTHHKDLRELVRYARDPDDEGSCSSPFQERLAEVIPNLQKLSGILKEYPRLMNRYFGEPADLRPIDLTEYTDESWERILRSASKCLRNDTCRQRLKYIGIFGKGSFNTCDYLASGGARKVLKPLPSLDAVFTYPAYTSIQERCRETKGDAIVISPTGSGKTEAALFWATNNLNRAEGNRIFYSLPYTASINAMYQRLSRRLTPCYNDEGCVSLLHGKASYYLSKMYDDANESRFLRDVAKKIYSPYKIMTPYQSLKHLFSIKGYEMGLLEMYQGSFILDEIHAYDARTVGLILSMSEFVKNELDARILLMSATLPEFIKDIFVNSLGISNILTMDKHELSRYTRHECSLLDGEICDHIDKIKNTLRGDERVLVVCNTVKQAQRVYNSLKGIKHRSGLLHSRFTLGDREKIEREVDSLDLLVGTQAIEVSLDIDYDVCYSEPAPIDALIQRFGRINRRRRKDVCRVYVFTRGSEQDRFIYDDSLVERTLEELGDLELLHEWVIQDITDKIYRNGFGNDEKLFRDVRRTFSRVIEGIVPFSNSDQAEADFYRLFNSVEAVPERFRTDYLDSIQAGDIYRAMQYTLPLSRGQYHRLKGEGRISKTEGMLFVNARYDSDLGLLVEERDPEAFTE